MIFAHTIDLVLSGQKTQTRRPIKCGETYDETLKAIRSRAGRRITYRVGKTYAVQPGRGQPAIARMRITNVRQEPLAAITTADAIAEGYDSREEFLTIWRTMHGQTDPDQMVWVLTFELEERCAGPKQY